ncbi:MULTISPECIES: murein L,D-transpeptidase catalytic domain family protein [unclassified Myroides]|uniref:murein L,D-transpeptidase catalytic domain family protein n=1 Tax=unclassified Myroides TaxID=2642485 RepID=UPI003100D786
MKNKTFYCSLIAIMLCGNFVGSSTLNAAKSKSDNLTYKIEETKESSFETKASSLFSNLDLKGFDAPSQNVFTKALKGYYKLAESGKIQNEKLTIVDFSLSSSIPRLWVIDLKENAVVLQSYVAHGKKTGDEFATTFSNRENSHMSSLGFYTTGETYSGRNGFSLRLDGLESGINDNARKRAIVIHGADYASRKLIDAQGRLGRSYGCPAVPQEVNKELIELIKDKSCLFIYYPSNDYTNRSKLV